MEVTLCPECKNHLEIDNIKNIVCNCCGSKIEVKKVFLRKYKEYKMDCIHSVKYCKQTGGLKCTKCKKLLNDFGKEY